MSLARYGHALRGINVVDLVDVGIVGGWRLRVYWEQRRDPEDFQCRARYHSPACSLLRVEWGSLDHLGIWYLRHYIRHEQE
jgi:hypothetical protein